MIKAVLGVWLAMLLFRNLKFKRLIRGAVLLPWVIPTALSMLAWGWMFDSLYSVVNWTADPPGDRQRARAQLAGHGAATPWPR